MKITLLALVAVLCLTFAASAADLTGKWTVDTSAAPAGGGQAAGGGAPAGGGMGGGGRMGGAGGMGGGTYEFKVSGATLTGSITQPGRNGADPTVTQIADGKITGDTFTFSVTRSMGGNDMKLLYTGKWVGDKLEISVDMGGGRGARTTTLKRAE